MIRFFIKLFFFVGLCAGIFAIHSTLDQKGFYNLENIEVQLAAVPENHKKYFDAQLMEFQSRLKNYEGISLWKLDIQKMNQDAGALNWIETFQISRRWPNSLFVQIQPKAIVLNSLTSKGLVKPLTVSGDMLKEVNMKSAPDLPFIQGSELLKKDDLKKQLLSVVKQIPENGKFSMSKISEIGFDKDSGYWVRMMDTRVRVNLGFEQINIKSARVSEVMNYLEENSIYARVIDADLSKKVLVKMRKDP